MIEENITKYKVCVEVYKEINPWLDSRHCHRHHIKPKSLYPELANDWYNNIVVVPDIVHWALHKWLLAHYRETGNQAAVEKMEKVDLETYINDNLKKTKFDFSAGDKILELLEEKLIRYVEKRQSHKNRAVIYGGTKDGKILKIKAAPGFKVPKTLESILVRGKEGEPQDESFPLGFRLSRDHLDLAMKNLELVTSLWHHGRIKALGLEEVKPFVDIDEELIRDDLAEFHDIALQKFGQKTVDELDIPDNYLDDYVKLIPLTLDDI